jgi:hypothetical protein
VDELSNSTWVNSSSNPMWMNSQIQHGWTQVQIPCGWTLKFNMGELKFKSHMDELSNSTWANSSSNSIWMNSRIQHGWAQTLNYALSKFNMGEIKFKFNMGWNSNSQLCTLKFNMGWTQNSQYYVLTNSRWVNLSSKFNMGVSTHLCTPHWWPKKCASLHEISVVHFAFNATHLSKMEEHHDNSTRVSNCRWLDFLLVSHQGLFLWNAAFCEWAGSIAFVV